MHSNAHMLALLYYSGVSQRRAVQRSSQTRFLRRSVYTELVCIVGKYYETQFAWCSPNLYWLFSLPHSPWAKKRHFSQPYCSQMGCGKCHKQTSAFRSVLVGTNLPSVFSFTSCCMGLFLAQLLRVCHDLNSGDFIERQQQLHIWCTQILHKPE